MSSKPKQFEQDIKLNKNKLIDFSLDGTLSNLTEESQFGYSAVLKYPVWNNGTSVVSVLDTPINSFSLPTGNINLNNHKIVNLQDPVNYGDGVNLVKLDLSLKDLLYSFILNTGLYENLTYDRFLISGSGISTQSGLTYDSNSFRYGTTISGYFETPNLITVSGTYYDFNFFLQTSSSFTLEYKTSLIGSYVSFLPEENINIPSGFTELYIKATFTSVGSVSSYGLNYGVSSIHTLNNLSDVIINSPIEDNILKYDGSNWINSSNLLYVGTSNGVFTTNGSIVPTGLGSLSLSSNYFKIGKVLKLSIVLNNTLTPTITFKLGSTTIMTTSNTTSDVKLELTIVCRSDGISGNIQVSLVEHKSNPSHYIYITNQNVSIDTTIPLLLDVVYNGTGVLTVYEFICKLES